MKLAASAFALLLASGIAAYAQGTATPSSPGTSASPSSSNQCWDMATNTVKNSQGATLSQGANTSAQAPAPGTSSANPPPAAGSATTGAAPTTRPAGMPTC